MTPFGGEHFRLTNFDNARIVGSEIHPIFESPKARLHAVVPPEIADTPLDAKRKPQLTTAVDIWSLGVLIFIMRTACLPMNRDTTHAVAKAQTFDAEGIINSSQYSRIFDEDQRDFLIKCMQPDPAKRWSAE